MEHEDERSVSLGTEVSASVPPPSPLTGCYLLIVVGEPHDDHHKEIILQRLLKGFLSWDSTENHVDLEKELATLTAAAPDGEEARYGERLIQFATENLVTEVLVHPQMNTLMQCMRNLLSSFTRHRHIIHAGYTFAGNGSWIMQDGTFSLADFTDAFQENEVQRVIRAYENSITIDIHCSVAGGAWQRLPGEPYAQQCRIRVNPTDVLPSGSKQIGDFIAYVEKFIVPASIEQLLVSSDVVGNIRFSHPTLYVFPGGQGDAALFGINGFNMLVDGGFARKACWWDFARHLDRLDAVLFTRLNNCSAAGMGAVLKRKATASVYPQIGHFFCNLEARGAGDAPSPDGDKDRDPLLMSLLQQGHDMMESLRAINLRPQNCYRGTEPVNLYHKVGHGTLDMYVLNPSKDSKYVREFLHKWHSNDQKLFEGAGSSAAGSQFSFPVPNLVSICALLVWRPANPDDNVTRIMFPGSTPQHKIFEGLERLRHLEFMRTPTCTGRQIAAASAPPAAPPAPAAAPPAPLAVTRTVRQQLSSRVVKERSVASDKTIDDKLEREKEEPPAPLKDLPDEQLDNRMLSELADAKEGKLENILHDALVSRVHTDLAHDSSNKADIIIEKIGAKKQKDKRKEKYSSERKTRKSEKAEESKESSLAKSMETKKSHVDVKNRVETRRKTEVRSKVESTVSTTRTRSRTRTASKTMDRKTISAVEKRKDGEETKSPSTTPKKDNETKSGPLPKELPKDKLKVRTRRFSPSTTPAKSAKEASNRRVAESKYKQVSPKREVPQKVSEKKEIIKVKREPISRRPKPISSPVKGLRSVKSPSKTIKSLDRTNIEKSVTKRSVVRDYEDLVKDSKKSDEETSKSIDEAKQQEIDEREEQEIVREIEAVFNRDSEAEEKQEFIARSDIEQIREVLDDLKTDAVVDEEFEEEYLIIEKEEIEQFTEDSINEHDSSREKEDEMQKHLRDTEESEKKMSKGTVNASIHIENDLMAKIDETRKEVKTEEMSTSIEEKQDGSSEKKTTDSKDDDVDIEKPKGSIETRNIVQESQPDEKISTTVESGATTAPTLPEDERITLDEIKEDQPVEEKHIKEDNKEVIPPQAVDSVPTKPSVLTSKLQTQAAPIREIVKTPDEVADLPLHEEADYRSFEDFVAKKADQTETTKLKQEVQKNNLEDDIFRRKPDLGFIHEIKVPKDLPLSDAKKDLSKPYLERGIQDDVVIRTMQVPSHAELVTVTPGSAPESPGYMAALKESVSNMTMEPIKEFEHPTAVKEYAHYSYPQFTGELRETHITTVDSPIKEETHIIEDIQILSDKIPSIPEDIEKELEETAKLESRLDKIKEIIVIKSESDEQKETKSDMIRSPIDVEKIVADVAEVLKSDKSLEEIMSGKTTPLLGYEEKEDIKQKEDTELQKRKGVINENEPDEDQTNKVVERMIVTASSEDGGKVTEICRKESITYKTDTTDLKESEIASQASTKEAVVTIDKIAFSTSSPIKSIISEEMSDMSDKTVLSKESQHVTAEESALEKRKESVPSVKDETLDNLFPRSGKSTREESDLVSSLTEVRKDSVPSIKDETPEKENSRCGKSTPEEHVGKLSPAKELSAPVALSADKVSPLDTKEERLEESAPMSPLQGDRKESVPSIKDEILEKEVTRSGKSTPEKHVGKLSPAKEVSAPVGLSAGKMSPIDTEKAYAEESSAKSPLKGDRKESLPSIKDDTAEKEVTRSSKSTPEEHAGKLSPAKELSAPVALSADKVSPLDTKEERLEESAPMSPLQGDRKESVPSIKDEILEKEVTRSGKSTPEKNVGMLSPAKEGSAQVALSAGKVSPLDTKEELLEESAPKSPLQGDRKESVPSIKEEVLEKQVTRSEMSTPEEHVAKLSPAKELSAPVALSADKVSPLDSKEEHLEESAPMSPLQGDRKESVPSIKDEILEKEVTRSGKSTPEEHVGKLSPAKEVSAPVGLSAGKMSPIDTEKAYAEESSTKSPLKGDRKESLPSIKDDTAEKEVTRSSKSTPEEHAGKLSPAEEVSAPVALNAGKVSPISTREAHSEESAPKSDLEGNGKESIPSIKDESPKKEDTRSGKSTPKEHVGKLSPTKKESAPDALSAGKVSPIITREAHSEESAPKSPLEGDRKESLPSINEEVPRRETFISEEHVGKPAREVSATVRLSACKISPIDIKEARLEESVPKSPLEGDRKESVHSIKDEIPEKEVTRSGKSTPEEHVGNLSVAKIVSAPVALSPGKFSSIDTKEAHAEESATKSPLKEDRKESVPSIKDEIPGKQVPRSGKSTPEEHIDKLSPAKKVSAPVGLSAGKMSPIDTEKAYAEESSTKSPLKGYRKESVPSIKDETSEKEVTRSRMSTPEEHVDKLSSAKDVSAPVGLGAGKVSPIDTKAERLEESAPKSPPEGDRKDSVPSIKDEIPEKEVTRSGKSSPAKLSPAKEVSAPVALSVGKVSPLNIKESHAEESAPKSPLQDDRKESVPSIKDETPEKEFTRSGKSTPEEHVGKLSPAKELSATVALSTSKVSPIDTKEEHLEELAPMSPLQGDRKENVPSIKDEIPQKQVPRSGKSTPEEHVDKLSPAKEVSAPVGLSAGKVSPIDTKEKHLEELSPKSPLHGDRKESVPSIKDEIREKEVPRSGKSSHEEHVDKLSPTKEVSAPVALSTGKVSPIDNKEEHLEEFAPKSPLDGDRKESVPSIKDEIPEKELPRRGKSTREEHVDKLSPAKEVSAPVRLSAGKVSPIYTKEAHAEESAPKSPLQGDRKESILSIKDEIPEKEVPRSGQPSPEEHVDKLSPAKEVSAPVALSAGKVSPIYTKEAHAEESAPKSPLQGDRKESVPSIKDEIPEKEVPVSGKSTREEHLDKLSPAKELSAPVALSTGKVSPIDTKEEHLEELAPKSPLYGDRKESVPSIKDEIPEKEVPRSGKSSPEKHVEKLSPAKEVSAPVALSTGKVSPIDTKEAHAEESAPKSPLQGDRKESILSIEDETPEKEITRSGKPSPEEVVATLSPAKELSAPVALSTGKVLPIDTKEERLEELTLKSPLEGDRKESVPSIKDEIPEKEVPVSGKSTREEHVDKLSPSKEVLVPVALSTGKVSPIDTKEAHADESAPKLSLQGDRKEIVPSIKDEIPEKEVPRSEKSSPEEHVDKLSPAKEVSVPFALSAGKVSPIDTKEAHAGESATKSPLQGDRKESILSIEDETPEKQVTKSGKSSPEEEVPKLSRARELSAPVALSAGKVSPIDTKEALAEESAPMSPLQGDRKESVPSIKDEILEKEVTRSGKSTPEKHVAKLSPAKELLEPLALSTGKVSPIDTKEEHLEELAPKSPFDGDRKESVPSIKDEIPEKEVPRSGKSSPEEHVEKLSPAKEVLAPVALSAGKVSPIDTKEAHADESAPKLPLQGDRKESILSIEDETPEKEVTRSGKSSPEEEVAKLSPAKDLSAPVALSTGKVSPIDTKEKHLEELSPKSPLHGDRKESVPSIKDEIPEKEFPRSGKSSPEEHVDKLSPTKEVSAPVALSTGKVSPIDNKEEHLEEFAPKSPLDGDRKESVPSIKDEIPEKEVPRSAKSSPEEHVDKLSPAKEVSAPVALSTGKVSPIDNKEEHLEEFAGKSPLDGDRKESVPSIKDEIPEKEVARSGKSSPEEHVDKLSPAKEVSAPVALSTGKVSPIHTKEAHADESAPKSPLQGDRKESVLSVKDETPEKEVTRSGKSTPEEHVAKLSPAKELSAPVALSTGKVSPIDTKEEHLEEVAPKSPLEGDRKESVPSIKDEIPVQEVPVSGKSTREEHVDKLSPAKEVLAPVALSAGKVSPIDTKEAHAEESAPRSPLQGDRKESILSIEDETPEKEVTRSGKSSPEEEVAKLSPAKDLSAPVALSTGKVSPIDTKEKHLEELSPKSPLHGDRKESVPSIKDEIPEKEVPRSGKSSPEEHVDKLSPTKEVSAPVALSTGKVSPIDKKEEHLEEFAPKSPLDGDRKESVPSIKDEIPEKEVARSGKSSPEEHVDKLSPAKEVSAPVALSTGKVSPIHTKEAHADESAPKSPLQGDRKESVLSVKDETPEKEVTRSGKSTPEEHVAKLSPAKELSAPVALITGKVSPIDTKEDNLEEVAPKLPLEGDRKESVPSIKDEIPEKDIPRSGKSSPEEHVDKLSPAKEVSAPVALSTGKVSPIDTKEENLEEVAPKSPLEGDRKESVPSIKDEIPEKEVPRSGKSSPEEHVDKLFPAKEVSAPVALSAGKVSPIDTKEAHADESAPKSPLQGDRKESILSIKDETPQKQVPRSGKSTPEEHVDKLSPAKEVSAPVALSTGKVSPIDNKEEHLEEFAGKSPLDGDRKKRVPSIKDEIPEKEVARSGKSSPEEHVDKLSPAKEVSAPVALSTGKVSPIHTKEAHADESAPKWPLQGDRKESVLSVKDETPEKEVTRSGKSTPEEHVAKLSPAKELSAPVALSTGKVSPIDTKEEHLEEVAPKSPLEGDRKESVPSIKDEIPEQEVPVSGKSTREEHVDKLSPAKEVLAPVVLSAGKVSPINTKEAHAEESAPKSPLQGDRKVSILSIKDETPEKEITRSGKSSPKEEVAKLSPAKELSAPVALSTGKVSPIDTKEENLEEVAPKSPLEGDRKESVPSIKDEIPEKEVPRSGKSSPEEHVDKLFPSKEVSAPVALSARKISPIDTKEAHAEESAPKSPFQGDRKESILSIKDETPEKEVTRSGKSSPEEEVAKLSLAKELSAPVALSTGKVSPIDTKEKNLEEVAPKSPLEGDRKESVPSIKDEIPEKEVPRGGKSSPEEHVDKVSPEKEVSAPVALSAGKVSPIDTKEAHSEESAPKSPLEVDRKESVPSIKDETPEKEVTRSGKSTPEDHVGKLSPVKELSASGALRPDKATPRDTKEERLEELTPKSPLEGDRKESVPSIKDEIPEKEVPVSGKSTREEHVDKLSPAKEESAPVALSAGKVSPIHTKEAHAEESAPKSPLQGDRKESILSIKDETPENEVTRSGKSTPEEHVAKLSPTKELSAPVALSTGENSPTDTKEERLEESAPKSPLEGDRKESVPSIEDETNEKEFTRSGKSTSEEHVDKLSPAKEVSAPVVLSAGKVSPINTKEAHAEESAPKSLLRGDRKESVLSVKDETPENEVTRSGKSTPEEHVAKLSPAKELSAPVALSTGKVSLIGTKEERLEELALKSPLDGARKESVPLFEDETPEKEFTRSGKSTPEEHVDKLSPAKEVSAPVGLSAGKVSPRDTKEERLEESAPKSPLQGDRKESVPPIKDEISQKQVPRSGKSTPEEHVDKLFPAKEVSAPVGLSAGKVSPIDTKEAHSEESAPKSPLEVDRKESVPSIKDETPEKEVTRSGKSTPEDHVGKLSPVKELSASGALRADKATPRDTKEERLEESALKSPLQGDRKQSVPSVKDEAPEKEFTRSGKSTPEEHLGKLSPAKEVSAPVGLSASKVSPIDTKEAYAQESATKSPLEGNRKESILLIKDDTPEKEVIRSGKSSPEEEVAKLSPAKELSAPEALSTGQVSPIDTKEERLEELTRKSPLEGDRKESVLSIKDEIPEKEVPVSGKSSPEEHVDKSSPANEVSAPVALSTSKFSPIDTKEVRLEVSAPNSSLQGDRKESILSIKDGTPEKEVTRSGKSTPEEHVAKLFPAKELSVLVALSTGQVLPIDTKEERVEKLTPKSPLEGDRKESVPSIKDEIPEKEVIVSGNSSPEEHVDKSSLAKEISAPVALSAGNVSPLSTRETHLEELAPKSPLEGDRKDSIPSFKDEIPEKEVPKSGKSTPEEHFDKLSPAKELSTPVSLSAGKLSSISTKEAHSVHTAPKSPLKGDGKESIPSIKDETPEKEYLRSGKSTPEGLIVKLSPLKEVQASVALSTGKFSPIPSREAHSEESYPKSPLEGDRKKSAPSSMDEVPEKEVPRIGNFDKLSPAKEVSSAVALSVGKVLPIDTKETHLEESVPRSPIEGDRKESVSAIKDEMPEKEVPRSEKSTPEERGDKLSPIKKILAPVAISAGEVSPKLPLKGDRKGSVSSVKNETPDQDISRSGKFTLGEHVDKLPPAKAVLVPVALSPGNVSPVITTEAHAEKSGPVSPLTELHKEMFPSLKDETAEKNASRSGNSTPECHVDKLYPATEVLPPVTLSSGQVSPVITKFTLSEEPIVIEAATSEFNAKTGKMIPDLSHTEIFSHGEHSTKIEETSKQKNVLSSNVSTEIFKTGRIKKDSDQAPSSKEFDINSYQNSKTDIKAHDNLKSLMSTFIESESKMSAYQNTLNKELKMSEFVNGTILEENGDKVNGYTQREIDNTKFVSQIELEEKSEKESFVSHGISSEDVSREFSCEEKYKYESDEKQARRVAEGLPTFVSDMSAKEEPADTNEKLGSSESENVIISTKVGEVCKIVPFDKIKVSIEEENLDSAQGSIILDRSSLVISSHSRPVDFTENVTTEHKFLKLSETEDIGSPKEEIPVSEASDSGIHSIPTDIENIVEQTDSHISAFETIQEQLIKDKTNELLAGIEKAFKNGDVQQGIKTETPILAFDETHYDGLSTPPTVPVSPLPKSQDKDPEIELQYPGIKELSSDSIDETVTKIVHVGDDVVTQRISTSTEKLQRTPKSSEFEATEHSEAISLMQQSVGKLQTETDTVTKVIKEGENVVTQTITTVTTKEILSREDGTPQNIKTTIETTTLSKSSDGSTITTKDTQTLLSECSSSLKSSSLMDETSYVRDEETHRKEIREECSSRSTPSKESSESSSSQVIIKPTERTVTKRTDNITKDGILIIQTTTTTTLREYITDNNVKRIKETVETLTECEYPNGKTEAQKETKVDYLDFAEDTSDHIEDNVEDTTIDTDVTKKIVKENNTDIILTITTTTKKETLKSSDGGKVVRTTIETTTTKEKPDGSSSVEKEVKVKTEQLPTKDSPELDNILEGFIMKEEPEESVVHDSMDVSKNNITIKRHIITKIRTIKFVDSQGILKKIKTITETTTTDKYPDGSSQSTVDTRTVIEDATTQDISEPKVLPELLGFTNVESKTVEVDTKESYIVIGNDTIKQTITVTTTKEMLVSEDQSKNKLKTTTETVTRKEYPSGLIEVSKEVNVALSDYTEAGGDEFQDYDVVGETDEDVSNHTENIVENSIPVTRNITIITRREQLKHKTNNKQKIRTIIKNITEDVYPDGSIKTTKSEKITITDVFLKTPSPEKDIFEDEQGPGEDSDENIEDSSIDLDVKHETLQKDGKYIQRTISTRTKRDTLTTPQEHVKRIKTTVETTTVDAYPDGSSETTKDVKITISEFQKTSDSNLQAALQDLNSTGKIKKSSDTKTNVKIVGQENITETVTTNITKEEYLNVQTNEIAVKTVTEIITDSESKDGSIETMKDVRTQITYLPVGTTMEDWSPEQLEELEKQPSPRSEKLNLNGVQPLVHEDDDKPAVESSKPKLKQRSPVGEITTDTDTYTKIVKDGDNEITLTVTVVTTKEVVSPEKVKITVETTTISRGSDGVTKTTKATKTTISEFTEEFEESIDTGGSERSFSKHEHSSKTSDFRSSSAASDDLEQHGIASPPSGTSSGQASHAARVWSAGADSAGLAYSDEDDGEGAGSPSSVKSQVAHSPRSNLSFELSDAIKPHELTHRLSDSPDAEAFKSNKYDPMSMSMYGDFPEDDSYSSTTCTETKTERVIGTSSTETSGTICERITSETMSSGTGSLKQTTVQSSKSADAKFLQDADRHFERAIEEHTKVCGSDLMSNITAKYEFDGSKVSETSHATDVETIVLGNLKIDSRKVTEESSSTKTSSTSKSKSHSSTETTSSRTTDKTPPPDPIESWGKPLGLPSPVAPPPPADGKGTPKKQAPVATNVLNKNKLNQEKSERARRVTDSPSKKKKIAPVYMDLTYVPHHGNSYYSAMEFFKRVRARYYVFSGTEPSKEIYNALLDAKKTWEDKDLEVTIIPTYDTDVLGYWVTENEEALEKYKIDLSPSASRCTINLQDHETSCAAYRLEF